MNKVKHTYCAYCGRQDGIVNVEYKEGKSVHTWEPKGQEWAGKGGAKMKRKKDDFDKAVEAFEDFKETQRLLAEAQKQLMEAVKIQQAMLNDLKDYVNRRGDLLLDLINKTVRAYEKK